MVLAQVRDSIKVWPVKVNDFDVRPVLGPSPNEITVLDTFRVEKSPRSLEEIVKLRDTHTNTSTSRWLDQMRSRIERELSKWQLLYSANF